MSFSRRLAAGLPTVGATVLVALALGGAPAVAAADLGLRAGHAAITPSPDPGDQRGNPGYGGTAQETPDSPAGPGSNTATATVPPTATSTPTGPTRGRPGYGTPDTDTPSETPSSPSETPNSPGETPETPAGTSTPAVPGGLNSQAATPESPATTAGAGLSDVTNELPVTGAPLGGTLALGGLMLAGGTAAVWYTRRRQNA